MPEIPKENWSRFRTSPVFQAKFARPCIRCARPIEVGEAVHLLENLRSKKKVLAHDRCLSQEFLLATAGNGGSWEDFAGA